MFINTEPSTLLLFFTCLLSSALSYLAWKPPNPPPKSPYESAKSPIIDSKDPARFFRTTSVILSAYHLAILLFFPSPLQWSSQLHESAPRYYICPNLPLISPSLFTWAPFTIVCQSVIIFSASLRLVCFRNLGADFNFQLTKPGKLRTTGLYAWVQHPSYTGSTLLLLGNIAFLFRVDGVQGCWLPSILWGVASWVNWGSWGVFVVAVIVGTRKRVLVEEGMLRETFGKEWEVWHGKTARFIPGLI